MEIRLNALRRSTIHKKNDTSIFALKTNLPSLKTEVDKLDIDKLVPIPVDLSNLSHLVKNYVVEKSMYDN